jgi:hypothetical protein
MLAYVQNALTGKSSNFLGATQCFGRDLGDRIARGYVTMDVANACGNQFPGAAGYFVNGGGGMAGNRNIIWGDYFYVTRARTSRRAKLWCTSRRRPASESRASTASMAGT